MKVLTAILVLICFIVLAPLALADCDTNNKGWPPPSLIVFKFAVINQTASSYSWNTINIYVNGLNPFTANSTVQMCGLTSLDNSSDTILIREESNPAALCKVQFGVAPQFFMVLQQSPAGSNFTCSTSGSSILITTNTN